MTDGFDARIREALHRRAAQAGDRGDLDAVLGDVRRRARRQQRATRTTGALAVGAVIGLGSVMVGQLLTGPDVVFTPADGDSPTIEATPEDAAPADEPDPPTPEDDAPDPPADDEDMAACEGAEHGVAYRVRYPADWWAGEAPDAEPCRWFHPEPLDMPEAPRDLPKAAVLIRVQVRPFDEARLLDPELHDVVREEETTVDSRAALLQEYVGRADGIYPAGTTFYRWLVDVDGRTLSGTTTDAGVVEADHDEARAVLDTIMRSLRLETAGGEGAGEPACSAAGLETPPDPPGGKLPRPVAEARAAIVEAAAACDYDRLADLAGDGFTYSFGNGDDLAGHLREAEARGDEPLRYLAGVLDRPHATLEVAGSTRYVWPAAFAYATWSDVPPADREALTPLYDEEDFTRFEDFDGYIGYRVGITADGEWLFFVAGD